MRRPKKPRRVIFRRVSGGKNPRKLPKADKAHFGRGVVFRAYGDNRTSHTCHIFLMRCVSAWGAAKNAKPQVTFTFEDKRKGTIARLEIRDTMVTLFIEPIES